MKHTLNKIADKLGDLAAGVIVVILIAIGIVFIAALVMGAILFIIQDQ